MPGPNSEPIFSRVADVQWIGSITVANNTANIATGTSYLAFTADATNGGFVKSAKVKIAPATSSAATVVRFWLNNGLTTATAANSSLIGELGLPATTTTASAPQPDFEYPLNFAMPPGYRLYVTVGTAPTAALTVTVLGGKY
jgi:hypothetical protein